MIIIITIIIIMIIIITIIIIMIIIIMIIPWLWLRALVRRKSRQILRLKPCRAPRRMVDDVAPHAPTERHIVRLAICIRHVVFARAAVSHVENGQVCVLQDSPV